MVLDIKSVDGLRVKELKAELKRRGLEVLGKKSMLQDRLKKYLEESGKGGDEIEPDFPQWSGQDQEPATEIDLPEPTEQKDVEEEEEEEEEEPEAAEETESKEEIPTPTAPLTDAEKRAERAQRFGTVTAEDQAAKLKKRAARFGTSIPTTQEEWQEKKKRRLERFGKSAMSEEDKLAERRQRFGGMDPEEKLKQRRERQG